MEKKRTGFRVDLRLLQELGERLISRDEIAIVELVKNSYDADAESVSVYINDNQTIIEDDGEGRGLSELNDGWLTIGTSLILNNFPANVFASTTGVTLEYLRPVSKSLYCII